MALIMCLETATKNCSVAINKDGSLLAYKEEVSENYSHSEQLIPFIQSVLIDQQLELSDLDAIAVSKGPGSYTGLRIGVSTAKGLCYSLGIPLLAHSTLEAMAKGMAEKIPGKVYCPMIDARRMEVYAALFKEEKQLTNIEACIVDENSFFEDLAENEILFFGDGADKCQQLITHKNASFISDVYPSAKDMVALSESAFQHKSFEDVAYFEPFYLKDFVASVKK
jgi:tRNA threonylcarbamoyladenosine biosynthesis protein TsaB